MEKRLLIFAIGLMFFLNACEKKTTPILSEPLSSVYAISAVCTQVETRDFPYTRAFCSIADQNDQPLFGFEKGNFSLVENGNPTPVDEVKNVDNSTDPLSVVLVLDRSGSMAYSGATGALDTAAINFVNQLGPKDEAEIINFDHKVVVTQGFTTNHGQLTNGITNYADLGGMTALYDAIGQAATDLSSRRGRKFILAMTDGWENSSTAYPDLPAISSYVNSKGLAVFVVGLGEVDTSSLQKLAVDSGGRYFEAINASYLNTLYQRALVQFNNEIVIKFRSLTQGSRNLKIYMNYGRFGQSFEKTYSD